ncbi:hypothetical protein KI387_013233, partial [Taxus chinensis]
MSGHQPAEKIPGGPRSNWDIWDIGTRGTQKADSAGKMGKNCLSLASLSPGQLGQKYVKDMDRPVWRKSVHIGRFGEICPRQSRTVGTR